MDLQEKHYLCESNQAFWIYKKNIIFAKVIKRSVTYMVKSFVYQRLVHGRGIFHKKTGKGGTRS